MELFTFRGNASNKKNELELIVDTSAPVNLAPFFKQAFSVERNSLKISETEDELIIPFKIEDFFQAFMANYDLQAVLEFVDSHAILNSDTRDVRTHINSYEQNYGTADSFYVSSGSNQTRWLILKPVQNCTPESIATICKPKKRSKSKDVAYEYYRLNPERMEDKTAKRTTTLPYHSSEWANLYSSLRNQEMPVLNLESKYLPKQLNVFHIISHYGLPTDNLDISVK
jgi:hypothetical protein